jgi:peptide-methionine (S)-S-oxide reductase
MKKLLFTLAATLAAGLAGAAPAQGSLKTAMFAGGCFWSAEKAMESVPGVTSVVSGYAGGRSKNPTYMKHEGHLEVVQVTYDPAKVSYARLVNHFFRNIDPTDPNGQICDQGPSYRTAIFTATPQERQVAQAASAQVARLLKRPVATAIRPAATFWRAEAYHQDFAKRNPARYELYRVGCGRDRALRAVWGKA